MHPRRGLWWGGTAAPPSPADLHVASPAGLPNVYDMMQLPDVLSNRRLTYEELDQLIEEDPLGDPPPHPPFLLPSRVSLFHPIISTGTMQIRHLPGVSSRSGLSLTETTRKLAIFWNLAL